MRVRRLSQFVVLFLSGLPLLANAQQRSADGDKVIALEKKWTEAYKQRNVGILSSLLAEECERLGAYNGGRCQPGASRSSQH
jgi:hypothetical protein